MTTITLNSAASIGTKAAQGSVAKPSLFARIVDAITESNRRRAEIETRRILALIEQPKVKSADYSMLPFQGE
jgi:hypothetical protein